MSVDPVSVKPMPGKMVVEIVEVIGKTTKSGLWMGNEDHAGKDTFYGKVLAMGPTPALASIRDEKTGGGLGRQFVDTGSQWPEGYRQISVGDIVVMPRDVPLVFTWEERRFGIVIETEAILRIPGDKFDPQEFEVVPWKPPAI